jgi:hypothetical protein
MEDFRETAEDLQAGTHLCIKTIIAGNSISQSAKPSHCKTYSLHLKTPYNKENV